MRLLKILVTVTLLFFLASCEKVADVSSPQKYEKPYVSFSYPGNWDVTEDVVEDGIRYIYVESPGNAIMFIHIHPMKDRISFKKFVKWFSDAYRQENAISGNTQSKFSPLNKQVASRSLKGTKEDLQLDNMPHKREYFALAGKQQVGFLISQVSNEDLQNVQPGFDLIFSSFTTSAQNKNQRSGQNKF